MAVDGKGDPDNVDGEQAADEPAGSSDAQRRHRIPAVAWVIWVLSWVLVACLGLALMPDAFDRARAVGQAHSCAKYDPPCLDELEVRLRLVHDDLVERQSRSVSVSDVWEGVTTDGELVEFQDDRSSNEWFADGGTTRVRLYRSPGGDSSLEAVRGEGGQWEVYSFTGAPALTLIAAVVVFGLRTTWAVIRGLRRQLRITVPRLGRRRAWWGWGKVDNVTIPDVDPLAAVWLAALFVGVLFTALAPWWVAWMLAALTYVLGRVIAEAMTGTSRLTEGREA